MRILDSIHARTITFESKHFQLTKDGRKLKKLRGIHTGRRCFIIGNGPSLRAEDLSRIHENGDISFGFNRIYNIFDQTDWRPTYYISQDEKMLSGCVDEVNKLGAGIRFIPAEMAWYHHIKIDGTQTFHLVTDKSSSLFGFSTDIARYVIHSNTVVYTAMQIAYYMGIREMVLIGVDHSFHVSKNDAGEIIVDPNAKDYFSESYNMDKEKLYIPNLDASTRTYLSAKQHAQKLGFCIYNATRGGKLEVFPRVELDSLFYGKQY